MTAAQRAITASARHNVNVRIEATVADTEHLQKHSFDRVETEVRDALTGNFRRAIIFYGMHEGRPWSVVGVQS